MSESKPHRRQPTKQELAQFKVLSDMGASPNAIGAQTGRDPKTVRKWLQSEVYETDDDLPGLILGILGKLIIEAESTLGRPPDNDFKTDAPNS